MTEQSIYNAVPQGACQQCQHAELFVTKNPDDEVISHWDCKIKDIKQCPIVIHDMSL